MTHQTPDAESSVTVTAPCPIVCAADEPYALPLAAMLESLLATAASDLPLAIHVVDCGLTAAARDGLASLARGNASLQWHSSVRTSELGDPGWGHVTGATYERLLLEHYVPADAERALWLDADLLVLDDIARLLGTEFGDGIVCAARDPFVPCVSSPFGVRDWRRLGLAADTPYFNAGVMWVDMRKWRDERVPERALDYLREYGRSVYFNEQEALNAVIGPRWTALDDRWNISANPLHARRQNPGAEGPAIVHFAGRVKPWKVPDLGAAQARFFRHLDETQWRHQRPDRSAAGRLLSWYLRSDLRRATFWLENLQLRLRHFRGN